MLLFLAFSAPVLRADPPPPSFPGPLPPLELAEGERLARAGEVARARRIFEKLASGADATVAAEATRRRDRLQRVQDAWTRLASAYGRLRAAEINLPPNEEDGLLGHLFGPASHPGSVVEAWRYDAEYDALAALDVGPAAAPAALRAALRTARALLLYRPAAPPDFFPARTDRVLEAERLVHQALAAGGDDDAWRDAIVDRLRACADFPPALWEELVRRAPHPADGDPGVYQEDYEVALDSSTARYHLFVPDCYRRSRPLPLLVALHYTAGEGRSMLGWWRSMAGDQAYLIVAPTATVYRTKGFAKTEIERSCILSAIDHVRARWAVDPDRIYLTGYSMGGHGSWDLGIEFADRWAGIVPMAGAPFATAEGRLQNLLCLPVFTYFGKFDTQGSKGGITGINEESIKALQRQGTDLTVVEDMERGHMLDLSRAHALAFYAWMDARRRVLQPELFRAVFPALPPRRVYWVEPLPPPGKQPGGLDPTAVPPPGVFVRGEIKPGNRIQIQADRLGDFDCLFGAPRVDLAAPVHLSVNGRAVFDGARAPDLGFMIGTAARSGDHGRLFWQRIRVRGGRAE